MLSFYECLPLSQISLGKLSTYPVRVLTEQEIVIRLITDILGVLHRKKACIVGMPPWQVIQLAQELELACAVNPSGTLSTPTKETGEEAGLLLRRWHAHPWVVIARPYSNKLEEHAGLRGNPNGFLCLLYTGWFAIRDELNQCWVGLIRGLHHQIPHGIDRFFVAGIAFQAGTNQRVNGLLQTNPLLYTQLECKHDALLPNSLKIIDLFVFLYAWHFFLHKKCKQVRV